MDMGRESNKSKNVADVIDASPLSRCGIRGTDRRGNSCSVCVVIRLEPDEGDAADAF